MSQLALKGGGVPCLGGTPCPGQPRREIQGPMCGPSGASGARESSPEHSTELGGRSRCGRPEGRLRLGPVTRPPLGDETSPDAG
eukprot:5080283-Alexandrium_andersonii.AAC.1